ncbi:MAG: four helix bundle protein [bacterium]|nr:four helix bundle protein [bacterium]
MQTYKDLIAWQKSIELAIQIYVLTKEFPSDERYGLTSQMRRAAVSISSNIAEGKLRGSQKEYCHFLRIAFGSGGELETQIEIARRLPYTSDLSYQKVDTLLNEVMRMLNVMIAKAKS